MYFELIINLISYYNYFMVKILIKRDENEKKNPLHPGDQEPGCIRVIRNRVNISLSGLSKTKQQVALISKFCRIYW